MSKQWIFVLTIVGGLVIGIVMLAKFGPEVAPVAVGERAPDYQAMNIATGDSVRVRSGYKGHVTLVNIWATWCVPCKVEMPSMQQLYDSLSPLGFRIAAVSIDQDDPKAVKEFTDQLGITFDILQDRKGEIQQAYQTTGVPESFILDQDGIIMKRVIGAYDWTAPVNVNLIRRLLGDTIAGPPAADRAPVDSVPAAR